MHLWVEIAVRELAALTILLALGIGPASFLGRRFDAAARLAIAPAFGLCLATCVFTTLIWFTAARNTYWLIPLMAIASIAVALRRSFAASTDATTSVGRAWTMFRRLRARDALALALVCVVVAAPLSCTLAERSSVGPMGYLVLDVDGYTATADGMEQLSIRQAQRAAPEGASLVHKYWSHIAKAVVNVDASPLAANVDLFLGLHATDTQSLFMIAFLVADALGAFAAVRYLMPKPSWAAPLAGMLFAGPLFLQLLADGSQAATCGLAVFMPMAAVGVETLLEQRLANLVLLAMLASGLMALYPLYFPGVVFAAALVLGAIAVRQRLRGALTWRSVRRAVLLATIAMVLTIVFDVVSFIRDVSYWLETISYEDLVGKPFYDLPLSVLPGWVLQTRQFYVLQSPPLSYLPNLAQAHVVEILGEAILPAILIVVILLGLWRNRRGLIFLSIIVVFSAIAAYASAAHHCSYCVDRNTLPSAPTSIVLLAVGVGALATARPKWMRWAAIAVAAAALIAVGAQTWTERQLFAAEAYYLNGDERTLVSDLPSHPDPVDLEGFGEDPQLEASVAELPLVYMLVYEHTDGAASLVSEYANYNSLAYLEGQNPRNPNFNPSYRYVLTRFGGVETGRRVLARAGPLALEERIGPLDVTITSGLAVPMVRQESSGVPAVAGALHLLLVGGGTAPAWVLLRFRTLAPAGTATEQDVQARGTPNELTVCARATGVGPVRRVAVQLTGTLFRRPALKEEFALPEPPDGIALTAARAVTHCSP